MLPSILAAGLILASTAAAPTPAMRAFPSFVLVRGGELKAPVVVHHGKVRLRGLRGDISYSPLATVMALDDIFLPGPGHPVLVTYEVAEYWMSAVDSTGRPTSPPRWDAATQYSRLHVLANGDVLWEAMPGQFQGARTSFQPLTLPAIEALAAAGVPFPPVVRRFNPSASASAIAGCYKTTEAFQFGGKAPGAGLPTRVVLETTPTGAANEWTLQVPQAEGSARGSWHFGRADMVVLKLPEAMGGRTAHLLTNRPDTLRGMVETAATTPTEVYGDALRMARTTCH
jgi:hypothetical protein